MKQSLLFSLLILLSFFSRAQKLDSLFFNLYTDSLKIGTYNYINVDGKYSNGRYLPLTPKEIIFTASAGNFEGNSLFIDSSFKEDKLTVRASLKANPLVYKEIIIYIKKHESNERLKTMDEIMSQPPKRKKKNSSEL